LTGAKIPRPSSVGAGEQHLNSARFRSLSRPRYVRVTGERPEFPRNPVERTPNRTKMADIFEEVDEEVRRDKAAEFWKKYQNLIIGLAVLIVLAAAGFRYWQYEKEKAEQAAGDRFQAAIAAIEAGKLDAANGDLAKLAAEAPGGYRVLAQMTEAGDKAAANPQASVAAFDAIAGNGSVDPLLRDAACLRAALLRLDQPNEEQTGAAALTSIAGGEGPYRRLALLTLGALALSRGEYDEAGKRLDLVLGDPEASPSERSLAERWLGLVASNRVSPR
jgi:hypothetical protein